MRVVRGLLVGAAVVAIAIAIFGRSLSLPWRSADAATPEVHVRFAYSSNLEELMDSVIPQFNDEHVRVGRNRIVVDGVSASSGDAEQKIASGELPVEAWSPASSLWGRLLNQAVDQKYVADSNPSLAASPVVIAMWEPLARALGWPRKRIGFHDILKLATTKSDWAAYGKPTFGKFKLGHTNPDFSTAGLSFVTAQYYSAAGKREGLTRADVARPEIRREVRAIERSIVHYGDTGSFFADQLAAHGPGYASAVAMEETTLIEFNQSRPPGSMRLVAVYPSEGTYMSDNPYLVLRAPWVTPLARRAAGVFGTWLQQHLTPKLLAEYRYRPGSARMKPTAPISERFGANPLEPRRLLKLPDPAVLATIKQAWHEDRKPANVLLVVDVSGSMRQDDKIDQAREGLQRFVQQLGPHDRVGLTTFDSLPREVVPIGVKSQNARTLRVMIPQLVANGATALYDATAMGWRAVDQLHDDNRINAVVLLSDGADTASHIRLGDMLTPLRARGEGEGRQIRIFTIAYGSDAEGDVLEKIATASGGNAYSGDPKTIDKVYLQISSFF